MFIEKDTNAFCEFTENLSKRGGNEYIFCFVEHIVFCKRRVCACKEDMKKGVGYTRVFAVKQKSLLLSCERGKYLRNTRLMCLWNTSVVGQVTRYWNKGIRFNSVLKRMCYNVPGNIKSIHTWWTNKMRNVQCLPQDEQIFQIGFSTPGS